MRGDLFKRRSPRPPSNPGSLSEVDSVDFVGQTPGIHALSLNPRKNMNDDPTISVARLTATLMLAIALLFRFAGANAMWVELTQQELVLGSNLIVIGRLVGETRVSDCADGADFIVGVIRIDRVLKGDATQGVALLALRPARTAHISTQLEHGIGQQGLWFLRERRAGKTGLYLADHPQRFVPMAVAADLIRTVESTLKP